MAFQFTLYSFSLMALRKTAVQNSFVKILQYFHICSYFISVVGIGIHVHRHVSLLSDYTVVIFAKLSVLLRCVKTGFGFKSAVSVQYQYGSSWRQ